MDFETLGAFYLGREAEPDGSATSPRPLLYDARDLTTHAVCIGMTGSGKTGLCIDLLEEAALDRVPALILDPKGDITNLLLTFPELRPEDFRPWVNPDDARRKGMDVDAFAAAEAEAWRAGLAEWGQDGGRIRRLREAADFAIYTPGSDAGLPVSVLSSFDAPPPDRWEEEAEGLRERIAGVAGGLLGLLGVDADPLRSREFILLANLFEHHWRRGEDLDLARLIGSVREPPVRQVGVFDVDTFFPPKERFEFAVRLNGLVASPGFRGWLEGEPLDIPRFLSAPDGRPRHSIFYLAHLSEAERMFFVTLLLEQVIGWMRGESGTTSLRALLYMDEVFGFLPPVAEPPSKRLFLTLLKQARAYGLGLVLTTQNPVDLDYKALTNAGTWFLGRLQTERDKARLLDGLESAAGGAAPDRAALDRLLSGLGKRVFLLHDVHAGAPLTFRTRWAMSYLRGPLTRDQVRILTAERKGEGRRAAAAGSGGAAPSGAAAATAAGSTSAAGAAPGAGATAAAAGGAGRAAAGSAGAWPSREDGLTDAPAALAPGVDQLFLAPRRERAAAAAELESDGRSEGAASAELVYRAGVLGTGRLHFLHRKSGAESSRAFALWARPGDSGVLRWDAAETLDPERTAWRESPPTGARFEPLPEAMNEPSEVAGAGKELADHLYRTASITLLHAPALDAWSEPGETAEAFRLRLAQAARERRDAEVDALEEKHAARLERLEDRLRRAEAALAKRESEAAARKRETLVSVGESLVGLLLGRRSTRAASSSLGKARMGASARMRAEQAEEDVEALREEVEELEAELREEVGDVTGRWEATGLELEEVAVTPRRADVDVGRVAVGWTPHWRFPVREGADGAARAALVPAY